MKKKAVFLAGRFYSHVKPLDKIVKYLKYFNYEVYIFNEKTLKEKIYSMGCHFIEYPFEFYNSINENIKSMYEYRMEVARTEDNIYDFYKNITKIGALSFYNIVESAYVKIVKKLREIGPDIIFCDSINVYGNKILEEFNEKCIIYITNNIYNFDFLNSGLDYLWKIFSRGIGVEKYFSKEYFTGYQDYLESCYREVARENSFQYVSPLNHLNPNSKKVIIFGSRYLQPKRALVNRNVQYLIVPQDISKITAEKIDKKLIYLCNKFEKIVYISHGSFVKINYEYYIGLVKFFCSMNILVIISTSGSLENVHTMLVENDVNMDSVYITEFAPQCWILNKAVLFINHGGMNSILETIEYEVPILINPLTAEQRINSLIIDTKKLGITNYKWKNGRTTGEFILDLLNNGQYKNNLKRYSMLLKKERESFNLNDLLDFIKG